MNNIPYKDFKRKLQASGFREERSKGGTRYLQANADDLRASTRRS